MKLFLAALVLTVAVGVATGGACAEENISTNAIPYDWTAVELEDSAILWTNAVVDYGYAISTDLIIGPVTICTTNGAVTIEEGVEMDEASRRFWEEVRRSWPYMFRTVEPQDGAR